MGSLVFAAKITHVPSMFISELPGKMHGCRRAAIEGLEEIGRRISSLDVDTVIVLDSHWLVNSGYHINACDQFDGVFTSNEFPHFIQDLGYSYRGNPHLGDLMAATATRNGVHTRSHHIRSLDVEYGTLVPLQFMQIPAPLKIISVAAWCAFSSHEESRIVGASIRQAIAASESRVALLASGSLSHRIHDNRVVDSGGLTISDEFYRQVDLRVVELWEQGAFREFTAMLPTYAHTCYGEGWMHDTAMLLGALGWEKYAGRVDVITPYFASSGTGQINAMFPIEQGH